MDRQETLDGFNFAPLPCSREIVQQQGQRANMTGKRAEAWIYCFFKETGYKVQTQYYVGDGIHGGKIYVDFYVESTPIFPNGMIVESKWQETPGSIDEKFPFLVESIRTHYPCPTIVVYGGGGARQGMIDWLKNQVDGRKLVGVYSLEEFMVWANRNL